MHAYNILDMDAVNTGIHMDGYEAKDINMRMGCVNIWYHNRPRQQFKELAGTDNIKRYNDSSFDAAVHRWSEALAPSRR